MSPTWGVLLFCLWRDYFIFGFFLGEAPGFGTGFAIGFGFALGL